MDLDDRVWSLLVGCVIGFILGYLTRAIREIKEELHEVDEIVKRHEGEHHRDEAGSFEWFTLPNIALLIVVLLTGFAAFSSQKASNEAEAAQAHSDVLVACNAEFLSKTIVALNERTTYNTSQNQANVDLQKSQAAFFTILLHKPPYEQARQERAVNDYFNDLNRFIEISDKQTEKVVENPYPEVEEFNACVAGD